MTGTDQTPDDAGNREQHNHRSSPFANPDALNTSISPSLNRLVAERHLRWFEPTRLADERRETLLKAEVSLLEHLGTAPLPTKHGDWTYVAFGDRTTGAHASALVYGDLKNGAFPSEAQIPVRVHSACSATELFLANGCGDTNKIESWMKTVHAQGGPGVIVYLDHDGRGNGMQKFLQELKSKFCWNQDGALGSWKESGLPEEYHPAGDPLEDQRDYHAARRIIQFLKIPNPTIVSDNETKMAQLSPDFVEVPQICPKGEKQYYQLKAEEIVREGNEEWKKPWSAIAHNKNLLQANQHPIVRRLGEGPLKTSFGDWTMVAYGDYTSGEVHIALVYGNLRDGLDGTEVYPTRVHSSCQTNEKFHAQNCECRAELHETMDRIKQEGKGIILYLQQEGRGNGVYGKMFQLEAMFGWSDGKIVQNTDDNGEPVTTVKAYEQHRFHGEIRDFTVAGAMLQDLGVKRVEHHSNNPRKKAGLENNGIEVVGVKNLHFPDMIENNPILRHDLKDKQKGLGHDFSGLFGDSGTKG
jgi:GTP cyclohydrolase II